MKTKFVYSLAILVGIILVFFVFFRYQTNKALIRPVPILATSTPLDKLSEPVPDIGIDDELIQLDPRRLGKTDAVPQIITGFDVVENRSTLFPNYLEFSYTDLKKKYNYFNDPEKVARVFAPFFGFSSSSEYLKGHSAAYGESGMNYYELKVIDKNVKYTYFLITNPDDLDFWLPFKVQNENRANEYDSKLRVLSAFLDSQDNGISLDFLKNHVFDGRTDHLLDIRYPYLSIHFYFDVKANSSTINSQSIKILDENNNEVQGAKYSYFEEDSCYDGDCRLGAGIKIDLSRLTNLENFGKNSADLTIVLTDKIKDLSGRPLQLCQERTSYVLGECAKDEYGHKLLVYGIVIKLYDSKELKQKFGI